MLCTAHQISFGSSNQEDCDGGRKYSAYGGKRGEYRVLVGKSEEIGPLGRTKRRWEDNIKMCF
jgi:hypothetical protein